MPIDSDEAQRIAERYAEAPGTGQLATQAATAYANARDLGMTTQMEADARRLDWLGYESDAQREQAKTDAAAARKEAAEERKAAADDGKTGGDDGDDGKTKPAPAKSAPRRATREGGKG